MSITITTFYRFIKLSDEQLVQIRHQIEMVASANHLRGLVLIGAEGINATVSGETNSIPVFQNEIRSILNVSDLKFKDSVGTKHPFHVFKVKVREEIVSLGKPDLVPDRVQDGHISPQEWQKAMNDPDTVVLDTRNDYEIELGKFKKAIDFNLQEFNEFPERLKNSGLDKDKQVLIYCTGGIRCEKAILEMREQGYKNVNQLEGGILNYLKEFPDQDFEGECFVFDYRVAVDQQLQPSTKYQLCPHCGQPGEEKIVCTQCKRKEIICTACSSKGVTTCSKNCAHHQSIGSKSSKVHYDELKKRQRA